MLMWLFYMLLSLDFEVSALPMMMVMFAAMMWINSPIIFCPQPTLTTLIQDLGELWGFAISTPGGSIRTAKVEKNKTTEQSLRVALNDHRSSLYEFWLKDSLAHKSAGWQRRLSIVFYEIFKFILFFSVIYSSMIDSMWDFMLLVLVNFALWDAWRVLSRPTAITLLVMLMWILSPVLFFPDVALVSFLTLLIMTIQLLSCLKQIILFFSFCRFNPDMDWPSMPEATPEERAIKRQRASNVQAYDMVVEYLYVNFMTHLMHLFSAMVLLMMWFLVQSCCVLLDMVWGLHSWGMLNHHLRSDGCCHRRRGFEPGEGHRSAPSARYLKISGRDADADQ